MTTLTLCWLTYDLLWSQVTTMCILYFTKCIKLALPQGARLIKDALLMIEKWREKSPAPDAIRAQDLSVMRHLLYCCATTTSLHWFTWKFVDIYCFQLSREFQSWKFWNACRPGIMQNHQILAGGAHQHAQSFVMRQEWMPHPCVWVHVRVCETERDRETERERERERVCSSSSKTDHFLRKDYLIVYVRGLWLHFYCFYFNFNQFIVSIFVCVRLLTSIQCNEACFLVNTDLFYKFLNLQDCYELIFQYFMKN